MIEEVKNFLRNAGMRFEIEEPYDGAVRKREVRGAPIALMEAAQFDQGKLKKLVRKGALKSGLFRPKGHSITRIYYMWADEL